MLILARIRHIYFFKPISHTLLFTFIRFLKFFSIPSDFQVVENEENIFSAADNSGFRERFSMDMGYGTNINTIEDSTSEEVVEERENSSLSWRMVSVFALTLRFLSIFCFIIVIFTSIASCIWYYGNFDPTAGDS